MSSTVERDGIPFWRMKELLYRGKGLARIAGSTLAQSFELGNPGVLMRQVSHNQELTDEAIRQELEGGVGDEVVVYQATGKHGEK